MGFIDLDSGYYTILFYFAMSREYPIFFIIICTNSTNNNKTTQKNGKNICR